MRIAVPAESWPLEARVAATPETVKKLVAAGHSVCVQKGAGAGASLADELYADAGAGLAETFAEVCQGAQLLLKVRSPSQEELPAIAAGTTVVAMFSPFANPLLADYVKAGLTCFVLEMVPRISRAQSMDVLSSQANIAGYKAVLLALEHYKRFMPMLMTAAGTVQPAKVLVMGAGVAGLQAIATARRLGAMVEAFDVRPAAREQVQSLGARFVEVPVEESGEDAGGYAKEMSEDYKAKQAELIAKHAAAADIVVTTALIPGRPAPVLVTEEVVERMKDGSVIVDLAAEAGGNCPLTKKDEVVCHQGVTILGVTNIAALMSTDASSLYARNVFNFIQLLLAGEGGALTVDMEDEIISASLLCRDGEALKPQLMEGQS